MITIEKRDHVAWLWLHKGDKNTLDIPFMQTIIAAHDELANDANVKAVIIGSRIDGYFCNGIDPHYLLQQNAQDRLATFSNLLDLTACIYSFPKPQVAMINGAAMAGGAVIGILPDFRFFGQGRYRFSFSEVHIGLTIPRLIMDLAAAVVGPQHLVALMSQGAALKPMDALAIGLANEVVPADKLAEKCERFMSRIIPMSQKSLVAIKGNMRAPIIDRIKQERQQTLDALKPFLTGNFEEGLKAIIETRSPLFSS